MRHHWLSASLCCTAAGLLFAATANGQIPLNPAGKVAACPSALPGGSDGWTVKVYTNVANYNNRVFAAAYGLDAAIKAGSPAGYSTGEPDLNFQDDGCGGNVTGERPLPGIASVDGFATVCTGWICFPVAKTYIFNVSSDDGFACVIGTGKTNQLVGYYDGGRGCDAGTDFSVVVSDPGVYAIQLVQWDGGGGAGIEFSIHENSKYTLVGTTRPEGMSSQPVIYGATNGLATPPTDVMAIVPSTKLNAGGKVAACPASLPVAGTDGWNVAVYTGLNNETNGNKLSYAAYDIKTAMDAGAPTGSATAEPDVNYENPTGGCGGHVGGQRAIPGLDAATDVNNYGAVFTGWICFPEAKTYTFNVSSDDGFAVVIGAGTTNQVVGYFDGGRGCDEGTFFSVVVPVAGIYAFQMIQWEGGGGAGAELTRFVNNGFALVGTTRPDGVTDQPLIYGSGAGIGVPPINILASIPAFDPGPTVYLDKKGAEADAAGLSSPGWNVATYPAFVGDLDGAKNSLAFDRAYNLVFSGGFVAEPDLNFNNNGGDACVIGGDRTFPGLPCNGGGRGEEYFTTVAKGWIQFPADDGTNPYPRSYALNLNSDDGFEVLFGTGKTNQVVKYFSSGHGCGGETDSATIFNLVVEEAGVYAIQIIHFDGVWGGNLEFFRRSTAADPRETLKTLVGATGTGDQPLVFGMKNGQAAPDLLATYTSTIGIIPGVVVDLDPGQKISSDNVGTGAQAFNIKMVENTFPSIGIDNAYDDDGRAVYLGMLEFLNSTVPGATSPTVNFTDIGTDNDGKQWPGPAWITCDSIFPGHTAATDNFVFRADGYAYFAVAGTYYLGIDVDDDAYLRFGNQTVFTTGCCPNQIIPIKVAQAGTYPIRVEMREGGGDARIKLYELAPGGGRVAVNGPGSTIKVYASSSVPFEHKPSWQGWTLSADKKVANVGQGGTLGWNAVAAKAPSGVNLGQDSGLMGAGIAMIENNLASLPGVTLPQGVDKPDYINYETGAEFTAGSTVPGQNIADLPLSRFLLPDNTPLFTTGGDAEDQFAMGFKGYIEFPVAGEYAFNCNSDDGSAVWIGGQVVTEYPFNSGAGDNTPGFLKITEPGIYDIAVYYFEATGGNELEIVQYLPDSTRHLINDPNNAAGTVKVYRDLKTTPASTLYHTPGWLPASAKVGAIDRGGEAGARVQLVNATFLTGDGNGGLGHDKFRTSQEAHELLAAVLDGVPSSNQHGVLASDTVMTSIDLADTAFPGANANDFAVRVTGVLALTKGGHILEVASDDGFVMTMAGKVVGMSGSLKGSSQVSFYVNAEVDGLYPFTIEYLQRDGGKSLTFNELLAVVDPTTGVSFNRELVNTGNAVKMYVGLTNCPYPFADSDKDGDVDLIDFGAFQACFTGVPTAGDPPVISESCSCFNRNNDAFIDAVDFGEFQKCFTGPAIKWTKEAFGDCQP